MKNNKVRIGVYLEPQEAAKFDMLRKTLYPVEASQSSFFKHIFNEFKKSLGMKVGD